MYTVSLTPSRQYCILCLVWATILISTTIFYFTGFRLYLLLLAILCASSWALYYRNPITQWVLYDDGKAVLFLPNYATEAQLCPSSLVGRYLCILRWQQPNQHILWQCVLPDMLDPESLRQFLVWAQYKQVKQ